MSQRGGSVISHLRWGEQVFSPIISKGEADVLVAFEKIEAVRFLDLLKPGGLVLVNDYAIEPLTVNTGSIPYPEDAYLHDQLAQATEKVHWIRGIEIAGELGNTRAANVVMLGALSGMLDLEPQCWDEVLQNRIPPKYLELNRKAFQAGRAALAE